MHGKQHSAVETSSEQVDDAGDLGLDGDEDACDVTADIAEGYV
jgi:hypothetical protein